jgi:hypothetical protein
LDVTTDLLGLRIDWNPLRELDEVTECFDLRLELGVTLGDGEASKLLFGSLFVVLIEVFALEIG